MRITTRVNCLVVTVLALITTSCNKPENYDECILANMKGQDKHMLLFARPVCERKFPFEKLLEFHEHRAKSHFWAEPPRIILKIESNPGDYEITRVDATFSKDEKKCIGAVEPSDADREARIMVSTSFKFAPGSNSASVIMGEDAEEFECISTSTFYGQRNP